MLTMKHLIVSSVLLTLTTTNSLACACCAEPGQKLDITEALSPFLMSELGKLRFAKPVKMTAAAEVRVPPSNRATVDVKYRDGIATFVVFDGQSKSKPITIRLSRPAEVSRYEIDPKTSTSTGGAGPVLDKEWRMNTSAEVDNQSAIAEMVLVGKGNSCPNVEDFKSWSLVVKSNVLIMLEGEFTKPGKR